MIVGENWSNTFREESFEDYTILYMYIASGAMADNPGGQNFDCY